MSEPGTQGRLEWGAFSGVLIGGVALVVAPITFFWGAKTGLIALGLIVVISLLGARKDPNEAREKAADDALNAATDAAIASAQQLVADIDRRQAERPGLLRERYGEELAERLLKGEIWQGQSVELLRESLGAPLAIEERVLKTKTVRVFKYAEAGENRYRLKVKLENGVVVGWEDSR